MKNIRYFFLLFIMFALSLNACGLPKVTPASTARTETPSPPPQKKLTPSPSGIRTLKVLTHDSFDISDALVQQFEKDNNAKLMFIKGGDAGTALNKVILSKESPPADVFYGVDNTFLGRALQEGVFEAYDSPALEKVPDTFKLDPKYRAIPIDYGDVCLNYDLEYFTKNNLLPPQSLDDLAKPQYKGLLVVQNPATSSPGLAFLLTTIGHYGEKDYLSYWKRLVENDVKVVNDWESSYYTEFSHYGGTRPMVVSYNSSPSVEMISSDKTVDKPVTAALTTDDTCYRQIEFVGILKGTPNADLAQRFIDFMLSTAFQEEIPGKMYMFPVNPEAKLNEAFQKFLVIPAKPANVPPQDITTKREAWLKAWTETVLR
ncbi:MAG: thiamine ABC transporter substrate-binding protein [Chloroflexota bacterium]